MKELSFEKALSELEDIVEKMEKGDLSLNESLALFERGVQLARFMRTEIETAEKKIEILLKDEKGKIQPEPFDLNDEETAPEDSGEDSSSGGDDTLPF
ncbi:MAG: exodeoxyribonuclease VII small subunit [Candidatus Aminicenantes bacterium]|nr:exodeoxyribonuclease VII small subunit [Candidatus Aminicenantes bacterium]